MALEISKEAHKEAIASIQRYFEENMEEIHEKEFQYWLNIDRARRKK